MRLTWNIAIILSLSAVLCLFYGPASAESLNRKKQAYINSYLKIAYSAGARNTLLKIAGTGAIPLEVGCVVPSEVTCKNLREILNRKVHTNLNLQFRFDGDPVIRIELFDKTNAAVVRKNAIAEFAGGISDVSDGDCEVFQALDGFTITRSKILISGEQPLLKLQACIIVQVGQAIGLGTTTGSGFAELWSNHPLGLKDLDDQGIRQLDDAYVMFEYIHMCPEIQAGLTAPIVKKKLELANSCISKIGGIQ